MTIPTPVPTTPDQGALLFYVLLLLIVATAALSGYALYRTTQKVKSDALSSLTEALAKSGSTIEDLLGMVGKRMDIENIAIELRGRVASLEDTQRELQRQLVIKDGKLEERGQEIAALSSKLESAQKQITAQEIEIKDLRLQLDTVRQNQTINGQT